MSSESKFVVYAALASNVAIATSKYVVAAISGSPSLLSEAIHSTVDLSNELLLLWGLHRGERPADAKHPFGYGREVYFWSFMVSIVIFGLGSGASLWEGIDHVLHPEPVGSAFWSYLVLGIAFVFEAGSWVVGVREFRRRRRFSHSFWEQFRRSKDPTVFTVVLEDSADLVGIGLAAVGIWSSQYWRMPALDGVASMLIGVLLAGVAFLLGREVKELLVGEAADPSVIEAIREVVARDANVDVAGEPMTMQLAPNQILLNIELQFRSGLDRDGIEVAIDRLECAIRARVPEITRIFIEAESLKRKTERSTDHAERSGDQVSPPGH